MRVPLVTIIIPCFNHAEYISDTISSIQKQKYNFYEIIVVDDGSTDNTKKVIKKYKDVKYIHQDNAGPSSARNRGLMMAAGEYVCFLDADDTIEPGFLSYQVEYLEKNPDIAFVYCDMLAFGRSDKRVAKIKPYNPRTLVQHNYIHVSSLFRASVIKQFRFDDNLRIFEDWDLYLSLLESGYVGFFLNKPLLRYRKHAEMTSLSDMAMSRSKQVKGNFVIYKKHSSLYSPGYGYRYLFSEIKADIFRKIGKR